ncbi:MAG: hypothetical protein P8172_01115 [Gammaproteobacteria bacterium]
MFRQLRIAALLYLLLFVAAGAWIDRASTTDWDDTLYVNLYPLNGDDSDRVSDYLAGLDETSFSAIEDYLRTEAARYGRQHDRLAAITLGPPLTTSPPPPPRDGNALTVAAWSLRLRWWAWHATRNDRIPAADIRLFVNYFPATDGVKLEPSTGLQKGLVGIVNAFADPALESMNQVIIVHELLHTLGATDKYDRTTLRPVAPIGLGEPEKIPLYPQSRAEIMAGRLAVSPVDARIPQSLAETVIGPLTATEIGLLR